MSGGSPETGKVKGEPLGADCTAVSAIEDHARPLAVDLFCGLGGWTEGLLAEGYDVIGFDIERHEYGDLRYPAQLVLQDVLTLHGRQFADAALIVASPPCQPYSYRAMPWKRAKALPPPDNSLFEACFRIQREACEAAGRHIPLVVENVRGAQPYVGRSRWNFGSFHLWGDVPALMPIVPGRQVMKHGITHRSNGATNFHGTKNAGGSWFRVAHNTTSGKGQNPDGRPIPHTPHMTNPNEHGIKHHGSGAIWFDTGPAAMSSKSSNRKRASALIAKIPLALARHIAAIYHPNNVRPSAVVDFTASVSPRDVPRRGRTPLNFNGVPMGKFTDDKFKSPARRLQDEIDALISWYEKFKPDAAKRLQVNCCAEELSFARALGGKLWYRDRELVPIKGKTPSARRYQEENQARIK